MRRQKFIRHGRYVIWPYYSPHEAMHYCEITDRHGSMVAATDPQPTQDAAISAAIRLIGEIAAKEAA